MKRGWRAIRRPLGVALVIVLWMLALLTVIANSMVFSLRSEILVAGNHVASARTEAAADAGLHKAIYELTRPTTTPQRWQGNGLTHEWHFDDIPIKVTIMDEAGKIDLNNAPEILLASMFRSVGLDNGTAINLADAVADWRDPDALRRLHGTEKDDYTLAGKDFSPRNANFESIEELRLVLGVSDEIFWRVAPLITVHSGQSGVASAVAPRPVLMALPDANQATVEAYLAQRESLLTQGLPVPMAAFAQASRENLLGNTFSIQVDAVLGDNTHFLREAVVFTASRDPKAPVAILAWRTLRNYRDAPSPDMRNRPHTPDDKQP
jgi:general secretion pathway protein K